MDAFDQIFDKAGNAAEPNNAPPRRKKQAAAKGVTNTTRPPPPPVDSFSELFDEAPRLSQANMATPRRKQRSAANGGTETITLAPPAATKSKKSPRQETCETLTMCARGEAAGDLAKREAHTRPVSGGSINSNPPRRESREIPRVPARGSDGRDQRRGEIQYASVSTIATIQASWRLRQRWHRAEKSLILQGKALARAFADGDKDKANAMFDAEYRRFCNEEAEREGKKGRRVVKADLDIPVELSLGLQPFISGVRVFERERAAVEKQMLGMAKGLPAYSWAMAIRGFGELNFVALVGECGDIGSYKSVSAVWKRMGIAVILGERQRRIADAELALLHGYNPSRRAVAFNLGECLIKAGSPFKAVYDERKAYELARDPELRPIVAHKRAARYMTKRVLRKLYAAWRKDVFGVSGDPEDALQAAE
jgi:hypothetical protein